MGVSKVPRSGRSGGVVGQIVSVVEGQKGVYKPAWALRIRKRLEGVASQRVDHVPFARQVQS